MTGAEGGVAVRLTELPFNPVQKLGMVFLLVFLFLAFSRVTDFVLVGWHLPLLTSCLALGAALISGGLLRSLRHPVGILLTLFGFWMMLCVPFSVWKGGSVMLLRDTWSKTYLLFLVIVGLAWTLNECRRTMYTLGHAVTVVVIMALAYHQETYERWYLPQGVLANANDLAHIALTGVPFLWLMMVDRRRLAPMRILAGASLMGALLVVARTGSRAALVGAAVMVAVIFITVSLANKLKLLAAGVALSLALLAAMPQAVMSRYRSLLEWGEGSGRMIGSEAAVVAASTIQARLKLLRHSVLVTLQNPVFGVGPGNFQTASVRLSSATGEAGMWRESHNTFTQVSSETGIPGALLFTAALACCLWGVYRVHKRSRRRPETKSVAQMANGLLLSLVGFFTTALFTSIAYELYFTAVLGVGVAFTLAAERELRALEAGAHPREEVAPAEPAPLRPVITPRRKRPMPV